MPLSTELPVGDLYEFLGDFALNGNGPPTTGRMGFVRLQELLLGGTSLVAARFTMAEGRLSTLEGLAGIPGGANLAADVAASNARVSSIVRAASYRPSDLLSSWTEQVHLGMGAAASLTEGGVYSIVPGTDGKVLRITAGGARGVGPIHAQQIFDKETYEYTFTSQRSAMATNSSVLYRLRGLKADDTDAGTMTLLTRNVVVADGFLALPLRISTAEIRAAMPLAVKVRPYFSGSANDGSLDVSDIRRKAVIAADPDQLFAHENVTGFSPPAASMREDQIFFIHGQSLAGSQNLDNADPIVASTAKYPGISLSMEAAGSGNAPRLGAPPDTFVDLIERATISARETMLSGFASHTLQKFDLETPPKITVIIADGQVTGALITKRGYGYESPPTITINNTGSGGTGAILSPIMSSVELGREVIGFTVDNPGSGYTSAPTATYFVELDVHGASTPHLGGLL
ncbi:hypothetical protein IPV08_12780 [Methylobacterium sp. SD274]|uniref:hypothetical protein n=1 Tax=Methylobacterium sp. SD274 TaxID=2782009 RepID=UPI001A963AC6|nr:hypothetical protein [Methylobacterium sp. SD274]MBO1020845.1 hypothetical protein [Methylobacterium sp. SD274]